MCQFNLDCHSICAEEIRHFYLFFGSSTTNISSEVGAVIITGDSEVEGDDGCGDPVDGGNSITGKDSQDENADDTTDVSNGKGDDCDGSGGGDE